ncbi:MAG: TIGR00730 family Rossman fold protein [Oscillospiraceae bacterium]|nr:TIGR00730 family Rossman fold protein [Oscillospiraceae bacterium]
MNICLYGASSDAINKFYIEEVEKLGHEIAARGHTLVYGGGARGLMGAAARGAYAEGGTIIGVSPTFFNVDGVVFPDCTKLIETETMRERKQIMEDNADAFVMVPGGIGTFEEFFEILTLKQIGRHSKAVTILNLNGYFDEIFRLMQKAMDEKFMKEACHELTASFTDIYALLDYIENYKGHLVNIADMKHISDDN